MRVPISLMLFVVAALATACASAPEPIPPGFPGAPSGASAVGSAGNGAAGDTVSRGFPLQPGDVILLRIWREPDLSGEYRVAPDGTVVLPKVGTITVAERSPEEVEASLREAYDRFLRNPSIEITLLRRVNILGFVRAPGLYPVDPTMTLRDVLALAGGVLPNGREDRVELIRGEHRLVLPAGGEMRLEELGVLSGDQLYIPERSWWSRNAGLVAGVASTIVTASVSLLIAIRPWE